MNAICPKCLLDVVQCRCAVTAPTKLHEGALAVTCPNCKRTRGKHTEDDYLCPGPNTFSCSLATRECNGYARGIEDAARVASEAASAQGHLFARAVLERVAAAIRALKGGA